jgi:prephenate dehydratase
VTAASPPTRPIDTAVAPVRQTSSQELQASTAPTALIGYAGLEGTVAQVAVESFSPLLQIGVARHASAVIKTVGYAHAIDAMDAVLRREIHYCVVPTSWLLSISSSFALAKFVSHPLCIAAESFTKPPLCLSAVSGTELRDCRCVVSDAALLQAHEALILEMETRRGGPIIRQAAWDSAGACVSVQEQGSHDVAVLATTQAAGSAGLRILVDDIHAADADVNARFLLLGRTGCATISPCQRAASCMRTVRKTTLLASVHNDPACLSSILRVFADAGVAVLAIQTRLLAPWSASRYVHSLVLANCRATSHRSFLQTPRAPNAPELHVDRFSTNDAAGAPSRKDRIAAHAWHVL